MSEIIAAVSEAPILKMLLIDTKVEGLKNVDVSTMQIFMGNHMNIIYVFVFSSYISGLVCGVEEKKSQMI